VQLTFLTKPFSDEVLLSGIRQALERSRVALQNEAEIRELRTCYATLTGRERQVMALAASGLLNRQVGGEPGISEVTVKAQRGPRHSRFTYPDHQGPGGHQCRSLARYIATVIYGIAVQAGGGANPDQLRRVVEVTLQTLPV
jgi:Bacterial regulatory proteins, luxR family